MKNNLIVLIPSDFPPQHAVAFREEMFSVLVNNTWDWSTLTQHPNDHMLQITLQATQVVELQGSIGFQSLEQTTECSSGLRLHHNKVKHPCSHLQLLHNIVQSGKLHRHSFLNCCSRGQVNQGTLFDHHNQAHALYACSFKTRILEYLFFLLLIQCTHLLPQVEDNLGSLLKIKNEAACRFVGECTRGCFTTSSERSFLLCYIPEARTLSSNSLTCWLECTSLAPFVGFYVKRALNK